MEKDTLTIALKWAATILVAGFIAQFGKKLADHMISRFKTGKKGVDMHDSGMKKAEMKPPTEQNTAVELQYDKLDKKRYKSEQKVQKKQGKY